MESILPPVKRVGLTNLWFILLAVKRTHMNLWFIRPSERYVALSAHLGIRPSPDFASGVVYYDPDKVMFLAII